MSRKFNIILGYHCSSRQQRINRSQAICPRERPNVRGVREKRRGILILRRGYAARKWITTAVEKTFKVNIVKIHFLPAIRFYSFPLVPTVSFSTTSFPSVARFCFFCSRSRLCTLEYNNPGMGVPVFASIR